MEAGDSRNHFQSNKQNGFFSRFLCYTRNSGSNGSNNSSSNVSSSSRCRKGTPHSVVKLKFPVTVKALRNKDQLESTSNKAKSHGYPFHISTTAAA
ncbi:hypothetical protein Goshw_016853 [Gossypium schwendimanii]|uniref:Uncharacterized protein n=1 Tax=Gossypium schwendimanii TaxID=34291 RepID=A0A7J9MZ15_GOSSC|nr:hypothetical protein [Gossypium schwendimanii]